MGYQELVIVMIEMMFFIFIGAMLFYVIGKIETVKNKFENFGSWLF